MSTDKASIMRLTDAILQFAEERPEKILELRQDERVIREGDTADHCFLVKSGAVSILVQSGVSGVETQVALRFEGDLIGETAFLQQNARRTASVIVASKEAVLIRLDRNDIYELLREGPEIQNTIALLWELGATRRNETLQIVQGQISVKNKLMSVLIGDIHNFSALGEAVWEEHANSFLFDFVEQSEELAISFDGCFEDQGDGFKIVFQTRNHARKAAECSLGLVACFEYLRSAWGEINDSFWSIGLGIGMCSDFMSIRKRQGSSRTDGRVVGHAINIASALSKHKLNPSDVDVLVNDNARALLKSESFEIVGPQQLWLEKLGRISPVHRLIGAKAEGRVDIEPSQTEGVENWERDSPLSVLFLASDPSDVSRLRVSEEAREIEEKLRSSRYRERFSFHHRVAVRPEDLSQALLDVEPRIVHFSGHGSEFGEIILENKVGKMQRVSEKSLSALFAEFSSVVQCVVLNACYSEQQAKAVVEHVPFVIGMEGAIGDSAAIAFSVGLYQGLGAGKSIEEAFRLGSIQVSLQGVESETSTPVLMAR